MKKFTKFQKSQSIGLPGGPNEMFVYTTGVFSTEGYKRNSSDVNNPFNIIPSGNITMEDVDFPVLGIDNKGTKKLMRPGENYQFPGDMVFEIPMAQKGGNLLTKTLKCNNCGWSWKAADGGNDLTTCHKCGGEATLKAQEGFELNTNPQAFVQDNTTVSNNIPKVNPYIKTPWEPNDIVPYIPPGTPEQIVEDIITKRRDQLKEYTPQSTISKAWEVANNPVAAASYIVRNQDIPDNFSRISFNPIDMALQAANPYGWLDASYQAGKDVKEGNYGMAALNALTVAPSLSSFNKISKQLKGARQLPGSPNNFKSEIDWGKWNPEIPENKALMQEYNAIEQQAKANGTWMKNPDGTESLLPDGRKPTPELWVQSQSKNWEKAYGKKGFGNIDNTYRGASGTNTNPDFSESTRNNLSGDRGIFTADYDLAREYVYDRKSRNFLTPFSDPDGAGVFSLIHPKGKQIDYNTMLSDWMEVNLAKGASKANLEASLAATKSHYNKLKKIPDVDPALLNAQEIRMSQLEQYINDFDNIVTDKAEFDKMRATLGDVTMTDDIARYISSTDLNKIILRNILDGGIGDVTVVNSRPGNYLKSAIGNNGMFDLTNPNIYKALVPTAGAAGALNATSKETPQYQDGGEKEEIRNFNDFVITDDELEYLNDTVNGYCPTGNCLENTRKAFDMTAGSIPGVPFTGNVWEDDLKLYSQKSRVTPELVEKYPYFRGDTESGAADSWDVQGVIANTGGKTLYNRNDPNSKYVPDSAPIGAIFNFGPANKTNSPYPNRDQGYSRDFGLQPSHHSVMKVGVNKEGNSILYDSYFHKYLTEEELIKKWKEDPMNYELEAIGVPKSYANLTPENIKKSKNYYNPSIYNDYNIDVDYLENINKDFKYQIKEDDEYRPAGFDKDVMSEFTESLKNSKKRLLPILNVSSEEYDDLANLAVALAMAESEGGEALRTIDGETLGPTQLNFTNIQEDPALKRKLNEYNKGYSTVSNRITKASDLRKADKSAVATMLYLSTAKNTANSLWEKGKEPGVRNFYDNTDWIDYFRDSSAKINKDGIYLEELNDRIDFKNIPGWEEKDPKKVTEYLNRITNPDVKDKYKVDIKDGELYLKMKTKGNTEMSDAMKIGYWWQSPYSLSSGDAQGGNAHAKKIEAYYNDIVNNKQLAENKKFGGELETYKKYVNGGFVEGPEEQEMKKLYDKMNAKYYKAAKLFKMSPPNYILTHVYKG